MAVVGGGPVQELSRPTTVVSLPAGDVEYRLERREGGVVLVFHGGHVRAGLALGEEVFAASGYTVLAPSRPGYGRTALAAGPSVEEFTDVVRALCRRLGIDRVAAVVGISGGGPTAATMAARHGGCCRPATGHGRTGRPRHGGSRSPEWAGLSGR